MKAFDLIQYLSARGIMPEVGENRNSFKYFGKNFIIKGSTYPNFRESGQEIDLPFKFVWVWCPKDAELYKDADIVLETKDQPDMQIYIFEWK